MLRFVVNKEKLEEIVDQSGKTIRQIQIEADLNSGQLYRILSGVTKDITLTAMMESEAQQYLLSVEKEYNIPK